MKRESTEMENMNIEKGKRENRNRKESIEIRKPGQNRNSKHVSKGTGKAGGRTYGKL